MKRESNPGKDVGTQLLRKLRRAVKLLRAAKGVINDELGTNEPRDIRNNPILWGHELVVRRIDRFLSRLG